MQCQLATRTTPCPATSVAFTSPSHSGDRPLWEHWDRGILAKSDSPIGRYPPMRIAHMHLLPHHNVPGPATLRTACLAFNFAFTPTLTAVSYVPIRVTDTAGIKLSHYPASPVGPYLHRSLGTYSSILSARSGNANDDVLGLRLRIGPSRIIIVANSSLSRRDRWRCAGQSRQATSCETASQPTGHGSCGTGS